MRINEGYINETRERKERSMKKQKNIILWFGKLFLVVLMFLSQMYTPIEVFAEEIINSDDTALVDSTDTNTDVDDSKQDSDTLNNQDVTKDNDTDVIDDSTVNDNDTTNTTDQNDTTGTIDNQDVTDNTSTTDNQDITDTTDTTGTTDPVTEETPGEDVVYTYKVTVNGEEVDDYTLNGGETVVAIHQEYDGEEGTYKFSSDADASIDFTNKLYGDYTYTYSVLDNDGSEIDSKTINIHYNGENSGILEKFALDGIDVYNSYLSMNGTKENYTVGDILSKFDLEGLSNQYHARIIFKDQNGNELSDTDKVDGTTEIVLTNDEVSSSFGFFVYGDYNDDAVINEEDAHLIVDLILDKKAVDEDGKPYFSILDATTPIFITGSWESGPGVHDMLSHMLTNRTDIYMGEEVEVKYSITGFNEDKLNGIEGKINYNKEILELVDVSVDNLYGSYNDEGRFAYLLDNYHSEDVLLTIRFKGIGIGESNVSIEEIVASVMGDKANLDDAVFTTVRVSEAGTGGDTPADTTTNNNQGTTAQPAVSNNNVVSNYSSSYIREIKLSSDSLIKSLTIKGYEINFEPTKYEYAIKVKNSVKSLDLDVVLNDSNATYEIIGNENFKVGENTVKIVVTAEDGSTSTYTIKVTREKAKEEKEEKENKSSRAVIIILIVLVIIGLIYVIFKDDEEEDNK